MSSDEEERMLKKQIFKNPVEVQKARLDRLMKNVEKPAFIPEKKERKLPRAFNPHEFVRNVMGASAGAGSGEFDIYRGCRRRQLIREAYLNREAKEKEANSQWFDKVEASRVKAESQTAKKRQKRLKRKANSKNKKNTNNKKPNETDESMSSSSEDEEKEIPTTETDLSAPAQVQSNDKQATEESISTIVEQRQPQERTDIRKYIRHRKESTSEEETEDNKND